MNNLTPKLSNLQKAELPWKETLSVLANRAVIWNDTVADLCHSVIKHGLWDERRDFSSGNRVFQAEKVLVICFQDESDVTKN